MVSVHDFVQARLYENEDEVVRDALRFLLRERPDLRIGLAVYRYQAEELSLARAAALGERMVLYFGMNLDYGAAYGIFGEEIFEGLADLFERVREELLAGNLSAGWAMYSTYGGEAEDGPEPVEPLSSSGQTLLGIMECH